MDLVQSVTEAWWGQPTKEVTELQGGKDNVPSTAESHKAQQYLP